MNSDFSENNMQERYQMISRFRRSIIVSTLILTIEKAQAKTGNQELPVIASLPAREPLIKNEKRFFSKMKGNIGV
ncbi:hypothetical protein [Brevibacillus borstelensis]|uniref:hypothetical protein n=1 Tax=Brevibacillus borstelensis TaxID=45462 RepID=UPI0030BBC836